MDQPCSGKTEISRNCGVRERKHAAVVELQMSWVSDTWFPQPEKRTESINSPWGMNLSPLLPHNGLPHTSPAAHRGHSPHWCPPSEKGAHPHPYLRMGPGRRNRQYQHWIYSLFYFNHFKLIPKLLRSILPRPLGLLLLPSHKTVCPGTRRWAGHPLVTSQGEMLCFIPTSHKTSFSWGTSDVKKPWKCWVKASLGPQHPHWGRARLLLNRSQPAGCSQTSFLCPCYF